MSPRQVSEPLLRDAPTIRQDETVAAAAEALLRTDLPALPVVEQLQSGNGGADAYWWALALGACFGGNATLVAAAANVAAAGMAARAGRPIGFMSFLRIGLPVTFASLLLATLYIALRYLE